MIIRKVPVLVVGAGPVGLSLSLLCSRYQIPFLTVEKQPGLSVHPRARGVLVRTMELFRQWGIEPTLRTLAMPQEARRFIWMESCQGEEIARVGVEDPDWHHPSPTQAALISQDQVERTLYDQVSQSEYGQVEFSKQAIDVCERGDHVRVGIRCLSSGREEVIECEYLLVADGSKSFCREKLGISMEGPGDLGRFCNIYCQADLTPWLGNRPAVGYFFTDPRLVGRTILSVNGRDQWLIGRRYFPEKGETKELFSDEYCLRMIRETVGSDSLNVRIINKGFWTMGAQVASRFRKGRAFLVGDAAHRIPPTGGFGMNTGIQDAHNLIWKLAYVRSKTAGDRLLDTYEVERQPVARRVIEWSVSNAGRFGKIAEAVTSGNRAELKQLLEDQRNHLYNEGLDLGFIYQCGGLIPDGSHPPATTPSHYVPSGFPGGRAPHVFLQHADRRISSLDLFDYSWVLIVGEKSEAWLSALKEILIGFPDLSLTSCQIGRGGDWTDPEDQWAKLFGIFSDGAVLVRPDGHVAWRAESLGCRSAKAELSSALQKVVFLPDAGKEKKATAFEGVTVV